jgi:hypothetical protein
MRKLVALLAVFAVNCGTIVHQTTQEIPVKSDPPGANVTVACGEVENDPKAMTPTAVSVHRKPEFCQISLTKEGYERMDVQLDRKMSGLYLGNILIGGIIGFIVDGVNGAMWNRTPPAVDVKLKPVTVPAAAESQ